MTIGKTTKEMRCPIEWSFGARNVNPWGCPKTKDTEREREREREKERKKESKAKEESHLSLLLFFLGGGV